MISAFIANKGKYDEGELVGEWLTFPTTEDKVKSLLDKINVSVAGQYDRFCITGYKVDVEGVRNCLHVNSNLHELNYIAKLLSPLDTNEITKLEAVLECEKPRNPKDIINIVSNLNDYTYIKDGKDVKFDFVAKTHGDFTKNDGYVFYANDKPRQEYNGYKVPNEYKIEGKIIDSMEEGMDVDIHTVTSVVTPSFSSILSNMGESSLDEEESVDEFDEWMER